MVETVSLPSCYRTDIGGACDVVLASGGTCDDNTGNGYEADHADPG